MTQDELKKMVGEKAATYVEDGMVVGLGTGSTVKFMVDALGKRVAEEGLKIIGVPTSDRTAAQGRQLNIPIKNVDEVDHIDLTIDGADQIDKNFQGIKGGGAAHLFEKIVAINSKRNIWIVDESKMAAKLGSFPLPLEVIPYGSQQLYKRLAAKQLNPNFRKQANGDLVQTDSKNYIIDLKLGTIDDPFGLADYLNRQVGVVEHGLFLNVVNTVIVGYGDGPKVLEAPERVTYQQTKEH
ncbi:ribose-5-phosphate isomerase RpiA [Loigolactobacillus backii]|uniref:Ribose-5-phosphate isomerase A n=1 Tax=Loigolactobacillus backii TaxID=375175 RepID=A0A192H356_9LACO|nr:ribose-5-phosphate isomerase RpiA [Loigolactobacillus backii]ANK59249.1 ribose-5-phosphate isomerase [Loigolactobacillus backii]ANK62662.1 ribose-5-phosphate isomerase [Loigolactobacillus backii]ANK64240.1 ribose-5-phosphate isomerase [Loigolactobacillus backii]ANK67366.1 ribose 5-phosphate isomerase A [Loigolactobacillus backii]ANK70330.1 ribose-5-phosphate isomerase [Loigolactobacillus backii]